MAAPVSVLLQDGPGRCAAWHAPLPQGGQNRASIDGVQVRINEEGMTMASRSNDDRLIPPDQLELPAAEAAIARRIVDAAPYPAPRAPGILERARGLFRRRSAGVSAQWPPDDKALDYHHFSPSPPPAASTFKLTPDDIEFVLT